MYLEVQKMVTHIDNTPEGSHNWLKSLRSVIEEKNMNSELAALEPMFDPANSKQRSADTDENVVKMSTRDAAALVGADFDVDYRSAHFQSGEKANDGYGHQFTNQSFVPVYNKGMKQGKPLFEGIFRSGTDQILGMVSGSYPARDGYKHVLDVMEDLFPNSCTGITVFGQGEKAIIAQEIGDAIDLGMFNGEQDILQPYVYTRMSLNRSWSTESIPMVKRLVCENALGHKEKLFRVKATANHDHRLTLAAEIMQASIDQTYELAAMANGFKDCDFRGHEFTKLVNDLFPYDPEASKRTKNKTLAKKSMLGTEWHRQASVVDGTANMWTAYNVVQGVEQHTWNSPKLEKSHVRDEAKGLAKTLDGKTPIADACEEYLKGMLHI
jgi:hypothetical protein